MHKMSFRPSKYRNDKHDLLLQFNTMQTTVVTLTSDELDELWSVLDEYRNNLNNDDDDDDSDARGAMNVPFGPSEGYVSPVGVDYNTDAEPSS